MSWVNALIRGISFDRCGALAVAAVAILLHPAFAAAQQDGLIRKNGQPFFPIGFYENPAHDSELKRMADSGVNLVHCGSRKDLDRAKAAGLMGWISLSLQEGPTEALRRRVLELHDHPALAVWEGPDEIVWGFTSYSGLQKIAGFKRSEWYDQKAKAVSYANREAARLMPLLRKAAAMVHDLDGHSRPVWFNEAADSDAVFVRRYVDAIDVTGCDTYPISETRRNLMRSGQYTDRWLLIGRGKPVWMVLQAFSPSRLAPQFHKTPAYPTFAETRYMAYDAIAHGAKGILYFGSETIDRPAFLDSIYAITSELAAFQPFLVAPPVAEAKIRLVEVNLDDRPTRGVRATVRKAGDGWLIVLVNDDETRHMAVEVSGLDAIEGRTLQLLYGGESETVTGGELMTRMQGYETKVFATSRKWESTRQTGRDFN